MAKHESKKEMYEKLEWYEDIEDGHNKVWKTRYHGNEGTFDIVVYPLKLRYKDGLISKDRKGWSFRITEIEPNEDIKKDGIDYDDAFDYNGEDAPTVDVAKKWAEESLKEILEERRSKKWNMIMKWNK